LTYYKQNDQDFNVPWSWNNIVLVNFADNTGNEYLGNASMLQAWTPKQYMQVISNWVFDVYEQIKTETVPNAWFNSVTSIRALLVITDSVWNPNYTKTGVCDVKGEDRFDHNVQRSYNLSAYGRVDLTNWMRMYCAVRGACDTVNPWAVRILWPSSYQANPLGYYAGSQMWIKKIFSN
jgi:hypothetical protein